MDQKEIIDFFDRCAPTWDAEMVKNDAVIHCILDMAEIRSGMDVLDVACGTGVLFPYYLERGVASVAGIDISPAMAKIAGEKTAGEDRIRVICGDVETTAFDRRFDRIVVYNAFPHFPDPRRLIRALAALLKDGGRLTIAHGASRESIDHHHQGSASHVSYGLMPADRLKKLFDPYFDVEVMISNDRMYQVSGVLRSLEAHASAGYAYPHSHGGVEHSHAGGLEAHEHAVPGEATSMDELLALMTYLVSHNDAHAQDIANLARDLLLAGKPDAYSEIMDAVAGLDDVNAKLDAVLFRLNREST